jgi:thioredoxin reductase (NADPH)
VHFSGFAGKVTMLVRGETLEKSMSRYLIEQIAGLENIVVRTNAQAIAAEGDGHLSALRIRDGEGERDEHVDAAFVFIGAAPRTDWLPVQLDERGFVLTGPDLGGRPHGWPLDRDPYHLETSLPGVFAAGDVRAESVKRVASAVGDGAMAVTLVHRYLEVL